MAKILAEFRFSCLRNLMKTESEIVIAKIDRGKTSEIRVRLVEFGGKPFVDVRTFVVVDAVERVPTRKGIAIPPAPVGEVVAALEKAAVAMA